MKRPTWELIADIVVVGYGGAGAVAAIAAAQLGTKVIVVEKQVQDAHTPSTRMSGGYTMGVLDVEKGTRYLDRSAGGMIPLATSRAWAEQACGIVDWLRAIGADLKVGVVPDGFRHAAANPDFEGAESIVVYTVRAGEPGAGLVFEPQSTSGVSSGLALFDALASVITRRPNVEVVWGSPARRLIQDEHGRVTGVEIASAAGRKRIRARRGVIMTCGGFEYDEQLKLNYLPAYPLHFTGNPGNTGDGIRMAQEVGADLWHMNRMIGRWVTAHFELDGRALNFQVIPNPPGYVFLDKNGVRFSNEPLRHDSVQSIYVELFHYDPESRDFPRIPSYWIFDERRMGAGSLVPHDRGYSGVGLYRWSDDNSKEVERGWIVASNSIEELATRAGITDPQAAVRSVDDYNRACAERRDRFNRAPNTLVPLDRPPFYCMPIYPGGPNTSGGPRRDSNGRVLDPYGKPIQGLFAAGSLGQPIGRLYPSPGASLSELICFGRIAAASAVMAG